MMPDRIWFVTWCDPSKYNVGPEQEYEWFQEEKNALAQVGKCQLAGFTNVAIFCYQKVATKVS